MNSVGSWFIVKDCPWRFIAGGNGHVPEYYACDYNDSYCFPHDKSCIKKIKEYKRKG